MKIKQTSSKLSRALTLALLLTSFFGVVTTTQAGEPEKILMIGNSLTYTWNVPKTLEGLAAASNHKLAITPHVTGGKSLAWHWVNPHGKAGSLTAAEAITKGGYDLVILQNATFAPKGEPDFETIIEDYKKALNDQKMPALFYIPFLRQPDISQAKLQPLLDTYAKQSTTLAIPSSPVPLAFLRCNELHPELALLDNQTDRKYAQNKVGTHQSPFGTYLAACTLYASIYHASPVGNTFHAVFEGKTEVPIDEADAKIAQEIAWQVWQEYSQNQPSP